MAFFIFSTSLVEVPLPRYLVMLSRTTLSALRMEFLSEMIAPLSLSENASCSACLIAFKSSVIWPVLTRWMTIRMNSWEKVMSSRSFELSFR